MNRTESGASAKKSGEKLPMNTVRGLLLLRGESLTAWSRRRGYLPQYVQLSCRGKRHGAKARRIRAEIREELGL